MKEKEFLEKKKVSAKWERDVWSKTPKPTVTDRGIGVMSKHGILGYGMPSGEDGDAIIFTPIAFASQSRAEGLAKVMFNRTTIKHSVTPFKFGKAVGIGAATRVRDVEMSTIPHDGKSSRFAQSRVMRKRRNEAKKAQIAAFMGEKKPDS